MMNLSFKSYIPVYFYAKNPANDKYVPVLKNENIRKCQSFVARNLNGTAKKTKDDDFVKFYAKHDRDYRNNPVIHSVYQNKGPMIYMVTGSDVDRVNEMAKPLGIAKGLSNDEFGHSNSFEVKYESKMFKRNVDNFIQNYCRPVKDKNSNNRLSLCLFFNPEYKKKTGDLKGFNFAAAQFIEQGSKIKVDEYISNQKH